MNKNTIIGITVVSVLCGLYVWAWSDDEGDDELEAFRQEKRRRRKCRRATVDNPVANYIPFDRHPKLEACNQDIKTQMANFYEDHHRHGSDIIAMEEMGKIHRLPVTSIYDKRDDFVKVLIDGYMDEYNVIIK
jgi:hypothetical protein